MISLKNVLFWKFFASFTFFTIIDVALNALFDITLSGTETNIMLAFALTWAEHEYSKINKG